ncbi:MAG: hypothetical protein A2V88_01095 [Elusimicrobia bacterium RBG_16_66_12]|nr:MAG: hypothetical protein A2V88_01095 [Elusimicrobia bacterium RBG_16_66_12]
MSFLLAALLSFCPPASAQTRGRAGPTPNPISPLSGIGAAPPAAAALLPNIAVSAAPIARAAAAGGAVAAAPAAVQPESDRLWTGGVPASAARRQLDRAHWETTKFFFGSRVKLLRSMIELQEAASRPGSRAVEDLEGMWLDWRVKSYSGKVTTAGFQVADRASIRKDALKIFDRRFPKDAASRAAFRRYLDRVDAVVPVERPSNYRKRAYSVFYELPLVAPADLPARIDAMLSPAHVAGFESHRAGRQQAVLASFKTAAVAAIREANLGLPDGKKLVAVILLGSYAIGQSTPDSDIDYQLMTQDGSPDAIAPFKDALDKHWTTDKLEKIEAFQFALPSSREVVVTSFPEGYLVVSPDAEAARALSKTGFAPREADAWSRLRGLAFGSFYRAWCWTYLRWADLRSLRR